LLLEFHSLSHSYAHRKIERGTYSHTHNFSTFYRFSMHKRAKMQCCVYERTRAAMFKKHKLNINYWWNRLTEMRGRCCGIKTLQFINFLFASLCGFFQSIIWSDFFLCVFSFSAGYLCEWRIEAYLWRILIYFSYISII
jgi:hypothetical protein